MARTKTRRTQQERSAETRAKLLDATIECLVELGYARTTTIEVSERSGLSRGAQLHHFQTKAELVAAAVEHLAAEHRDRMRSIPDRADRVEATIDVMWASAQGPLFAATLELLVAARTDPDLREVLDRFHGTLQAEMAQTFLELFGDADPETGLLLELTLALINGLALERSVNGSIGHKRLLSRWKDIVAQLIEGETCR